MRWETGLECQGEVEQLGGAVSEQPGWRARIKISLLPNLSSDSRGLIFLYDPAHRQGSGATDKIPSS